MQILGYNTDLYHNFTEALLSTHGLAVLAILGSVSEPRYDKTKKMSVRLAFFMRTAKTLIRLGGCPGEPSLGAQSFCWFCRVAAQVFLVIYSGYQCSGIVSLY